MAIKVKKSESSVDATEQGNLEEVKQLLNNAHKLDTSAVQAIYALKPVAVDKVKALLNSPDSRTQLQAARLIIEFGLG
jgi:hypothetical protein